MYPLDFVQDLKFSLAIQTKGLNYQQSQEKLDTFLKQRVFMIFKVIKKINNKICSRWTNIFNRKSFSERFLVAFDNLSKIEV